jgi:hypothetical protein
MEIESNILASLSTFTSITRRYELIFKDGHVQASGLLVEAFWPWKNYEPWIPAM